MAERFEQLADAYEAVAMTNHYMVGIVEKFTDDELAGAYRLIINRQNALPPHHKTRHKRLSLALDLIEEEKRRRHLS
jgi:hypothetical protein